MLSYIGQIKKMLKVSIDILFASFEIGYIKASKSQRYDGGNTHTNNQHI
jgi:hypothetical protein